VGLFAAVPAEPSRRKSPATALLLSLVLPGSGQLYCGKRSTGVWTMVLFFITAAVAFFGVPDLAKAVGFLYTVSIYIFAFLDAGFTACEANEGRDCPPNGNPRIAATLNLLTSGFGYFYLGERTLGLVVFVGAQVVRPLLTSYLAIPLQISLAGHAYIICRKMYPPEPPRITELR
jgi:TM2 domain-containing membrane protein YozV